MAINRLNRDQILNRALDRADSAVLDQKDRPAGTIIPAALSTTWLQEGIDYFYKKFPWQGTITDILINIAENDTQIVLPSDFILDYENGIILQEDGGRLQRKGLSHLLSRPVGTPSSPNRGEPEVYTVVSNRIEFRPQADKGYPNTRLWYYALPPVLADVSIPIFPDDSILVEYVWIKAQEWHRRLPIGSSFQYANERISEMQTSGIGLEAQPDVIPFDRDHFGERESVSRTDWMGKTTIN